MSRDEALRIAEAAADVGDAGVSGLEPDLETALAALPFSQIVASVPSVTVINGAPA